MHVLIHLLLMAFRNRVTRVGTVWKDVTCERCRAEYGYELSRTTTEEGLAGRKTLTRRADARLARALANACDPYPCPACGWFQRDMVRAVRRKATDLPEWVVVPTLVAFGAFVAAGFGVAEGEPRPAAWAAAVGVACAAPVAVLVVRRVRRRFADPNAKPGGPDSADLGRDFE